MEIKKLYLLSLLLLSSMHISCDHWLRGFEEDDDYIQTPIILNIDNLKCAYNVGDTIKIAYEPSNNDIDLLDCTSYTVPVAIQMFPMESIEELVAETLYIEEILINGGIISNNIANADSSILTFVRYLENVNGTCTYEANYILSQAGKFGVQGASYLSPDAYDSLNRRSLISTFTIENTDDWDTLYDCNVVRTNDSNNAISYFFLNVEN